MKYLTIRQVAEWLGIHEQTVRIAAREGQLHGRKIGRGWKFLEGDVKAWVDERWPATEKPTQPDHVVSIPPQ